MRAGFQLEELLQAARTAPSDELPRLLGDLEEIRCTAMARLASPSPPQPQADVLLDAAEAARRLGMSQDWLYRHAEHLPFTRRIGRRLLFSAQGIEQFIRAKKKPLNS